MRLISLFISLLLVAASGVVGGGQPTPLLMSWSEDDRPMFLADLAEGDSVAELRGSPSLLEFPVYQLKVDLINETQLGGQEQILYKNRSSITLESLAFQLLPNMLGGTMVVSDVRTNGQEVLFELDASDASIGWLRLAEPLMPGEAVWVELRFDVRVPLWDAKVDTRFNYASGILKAAYSFPIIAFHSGSGWDVRRPPLLGESSWREHALFAVEINTLNEFEVVSSGREVSRGSQYDRTARLYIAGPTNDFFWGGSYRFVVTRDTAAGVSLRCFAPADVQDDADAALYYAKQALLVFSDRSRLSAYPFKELDIVIADMSASLFGGTAGAEFSGVILLDWDLKSWNNDFVLEPFSYDIRMASVVFHEVAHNWFPVMVASDPIGEPWLDEGLAQLMTWLCFTELYGEFGLAGFREVLLGNLEMSGLSLDAPTPLNVSVEEVDESLYVPLIYSLGPLVLWEMLAAGDESRVEGEPASLWTIDLQWRAWTLLRNWLGEFTWRTASTGDFERVVEAYGSEASEFLSKWLSP
jgi:hypothetical protein